ncbi:hypothetical protein [Saccharopolyspora pogona]|uniref:hypothetical protein n=1 Tax=Saccharopolyspora pogona TaxID=333966 RepID=UPI001682DD89|nr:hypothetical protein [Saccharopolyspora pogona]
MRSTVVIPGLTLDEEMFAAAAEGLAAYAPELAPLSWEQFTASAGWAMIPDECSRLVKAEMVLSNSIEATRKLNVWFLPDLRGGAQPMPHSHPWRFTSRILVGGYTEDRYDIAGDQVRTEFNVTHEFGTANTVPKELYHEVTEIHGEPGRTLTLMVCERGTRGDWGYLDIGTGAHRQIAPDPEFSSRFAAMNPHL